jgi:hypothetical protein
LQDHLAAQASYKPNRHELAADLHDEITRRWGDIIQRYGYAEAARGAAPLRVSGQNTGEFCPVA